MEQNRTIRIFPGQITYVWPHIVYVEQNLSNFVDLGNFESGDLFLFPKDFDHLKVKKESSFQSQFRGIHVGGKFGAA